MTLKTMMTGNTPETIGGCLRYMYGHSSLSSFRVSVLYRWGSSLLAVGDDLEAGDSDESRVRKKRWWELSDSSQLRLPFTFYLPARILRLRQSYNENNYTLNISRGETNRKANCPLQFYSDSASYPPWGAIKAIRVHELVAETSCPSPDVRSDPPSRRECINMAVEAANAGVFVPTDSNDVYNKATGEHVGRDLVIHHPSPSIERESFTPVPSLLGRLTMLNGRLLNLHFASVEWGNQYNSTLHVPRSSTSNHNIDVRFQ